MKTKISLIFIIWVVETFAFLQWFSCNGFINNFHLTSQILSLQIADATNNDLGNPLFLVRAFHNKPFTFIWGISQTLLQYWDVRFLEDFIGLVGTIGVGLAVWYFWKKFRSNKLLWILFGLCLMSQFIEIVHPLSVNFIFRVIPIAITFQIISFFGIWQFVSTGKKSLRLGLVIFLIILSLLYLWLLPFSYHEFC